jgi:hypothetical protein
MAGGAGVKNGGFLKISVENGGGCWGLRETRVASTNRKMV